MIKLYYSPGSCSLASHIALEEAGADFEAVRISFADGEQLGAAYRTLNPKGKVPVFVEDAFVLTESPAILSYIAHRHPKSRLLPDDPKQLARCDEWLAWLSSTIHPVYSHVIRPERYTESSSIDDVVETGRANCRDLWRALDDRLGAGPWALGESYSVADAYLLVIWTWGRTSLGFDVNTTCPNWTAHAHRMWERAATRRAFSREGITFPG